MSALPARRPFSAAITLPEAERVASTVAGKGKVDNRLHLMKVTRKFTYAKT